MDIHLRTVIDELARVRDDLARNGQGDLADRIESVRVHLLSRSKELSGQPISLGELLNAIMLVVSIANLLR